MGPMTQAGLSAVDVRRHRTGAGPALVLLHCLGVDHGIWDASVAAISDACCTLRYDFPGHGESAAPASPYTIGDLSAQLRDVLDAEGILRASVAGISLGGLVAQHFGAVYPERVERLVLVDTTPCYSDALRAMWAERAATARRQGVGALADALLDIWFTPAFVAADAAAVRYVRACFERTSREGYALACEALARADLRLLAHAITVPTLVVCGTEDIPEFVEAARWLAETIPDARLEWLTGARHASLLEQPEAFSALLRRFLGAGRRGD